MSHPECQSESGHVCQEPSGRTCVESGCSEPAGTSWGPLWCPVHDQERLDRITRNLEAIQEAMRTIPHRHLWGG
jgi:hypothetical protein